MLHAASCKFVELFHSLLISFQASFLVNLYNTCFICPLLQNYHMAKRRRPFSSIIAVISFFLFCALCVSFRTQNPSIDAFLETKTHVEDTSRVCDVACPFVVRGQTPDNFDIVMEDFSGYSRTGNYINAMRFAIDLASACKKTIRLPEKDDENHAFKVDGRFRVLDFSDRDGPENAVCDQVSFPIKGNGGTFWSLLLNTKFSDDVNPEYVEPMEKLKSSVHICVMKYLGICSEEYCRFPDVKEQIGDDSLVLHLREGDIFPAGYESTKIHSPNYGQPPLSYYLQAINFRQWKDILVVTQPGNVGPIHAALKILNGTRMGEFRLQMSSWYDDLRTCLCAPNLVTSFSTLTNTVFPYGFAKRIFSYECQKDVLGRKEFYEISVENYPPFELHSNSAEEWVQTLLHQVSKAQRCPS